MTVLQKFDVWRDVEIGALGSAEGAVKAFNHAGIKISDRTRTLISGLKFATQPQIVALVRLTNVDDRFDLNQDYSATELIDKLKPYGLIPCPYEARLQLILNSPSSNSLHYGDASEYLIHYVLDYLETDGRIWSFFCTEKSGVLVLDHHDTPENPNEPTAPGVYDFVFARTQ